MSNTLAIIVNVPCFNYPQGRNSLLLACNRLCNLSVPEYREHIKEQLVRYCIKFLIPINYKVRKSLICQIRLFPDRFAIEFHAIDCCFFRFHLWIYNKAHGFNRHSSKTVASEVDNGLDSHLPQKVPCVLKLIRTEQSLIQYQCNTVATLNTPFQEHLREIICDLICI